MSIASVAAFKLLPERETHDVCMTRCKKSQFWYLDREDLSCTVLYKRVIYNKAGSVTSYSVSWCPHMHSPPEHSQGSATEVLRSPDHGYGTICPLNCDTEFRRLLKTVLFRWDSAHCDFFVLNGAGYKYSYVTYLLTYLLADCNYCLYCIGGHWSVEHKGVGWG